MNYASRLVLHNGHGITITKAIPVTTQTNMRLLVPPQAPVPIENWREPLNCLNEPPVPCAFNSTNGIAYDQRSRESCLFLNIYTRHRPHPYPKSRNEQLRPVMVYIYGGAFTYGSIEEAFLRPDFLLRTDIVLVTFNYRIGALGFLSVEDPEAEAPGNAGLKDQALALRWVHDNIANFGGDPERVTAFGQDAGAASVHFHMLSDMSRGLFQRAILQSGTALCQWALRRPQPKRNLPAKLAHRLGWSGDGGVQEMMRVLRDALPSDLVRAQHFASAWDKQTGYQEVFLPVVEPYESETCFLSKAAEELAPLAWGNSIPLLIGCNAEEGKVFYNDWDEEHKMFENADWFVNTLPLNTHTLNERRRYELAALLMQEYYGEVLPTVENRHIFAQLQGDKCFWHGCWKTIRARLAAGASDNTFLYRFSFITLKNRFMAYKAPSMEDGAIHSEELMYLFKQFFINYRLPKEATEVAVIDHMVCERWHSEFRDVQCLICILLLASG